MSQEIANASPQFDSAISPELVAELVKALAPEFNRAIKAKARMFQQLVKNKYMLAVASPNDVTITFSNKARRVVEIYHYGQADKQRGHNKEIQYPERQLLGITRSDKERVSDLVIQHLSK